MMFRVIYSERGQNVLFTKVVDEKTLDLIMNNPNNIIHRIIPES